ncbi:MAG: 2Fe-2S iron-sulfur cluster-binding protein [Bacteroidota bacterium]
MYTIHFKFEQKGISPVTLKNVDAGQSILELALNNEIDIHHDCGGICSCTTCHLFVEEGMEFIEEQGRREKDFIGRVTNSKENSRLGCQSLLMEADGEIQVTIPDQTRFLEE